MLSEPIRCAALIWVYCRRSVGALAAAAWTDAHSADTVQRTQAQGGRRPGDSPARTHVRCNVQEEPTVRAAVQSAVPSRLESPTELNVSLNALSWPLRARQPHSRLHPTLTRTCTFCGRPSSSAPISSCPSAPNRSCGRKSSPPTRSLLAYAAAGHGCTHAATAAADAAGCIGVPFLRSASAEKGRVLGATAPSERRPSGAKARRRHGHAHTPSARKPTL